MKCRENPRQEKRENPHKVYAEMISHTTLDGVIQPIKFRTEKGDIFIVARLINSERAASQKAGGQGYKYTCEVDIRTENEEVYIREIDLYHDGDFWFVERDQLEEIIA